MSDQKRPYRMKRRAESEAADPPADHRERGRAPRGARAGADHDQRDRGARRRPPVDRVPPLPRRGRALRRVLVALAGSQPSARPERLGRDRRSGRAHRSRAERALRLLRAHAADVREPPARRAARSGRPPSAARLPRLPVPGPGRPGGKPRPSRPRRGPNAGGDRPRAGVPDVALADAGAAAERRRRGRAHVPARRGCCLVRVIGRWTPASTSESQERTRYPSTPALLAQLVEHLHGKEGVDGSSPSEGLPKVPANWRLVLSVPRTRGHVSDTSAVRATHRDVSRLLPTRCHD